MYRRSGLEAELLLRGQRVGPLDGDLEVLGSVAVPAEGQFGSAELTGDVRTLLELPGGAVSALGVLPAAGVTRSIAVAEVLRGGVGGWGGARGGRWGRGWGRTGQGRGANKNAEEGSGRERLAFGATPMRLIYRLCGIFQGVRGPNGDRVPSRTWTICSFLSSAGPFAPPILPSSRRPQGATGMMVASTTSTDGAGQGQ